MITVALYIIGTLLGLTVLTCIVCGILSRTVRRNGSSKRRLMVVLRGENAEKDFADALSALPHDDRVYSGIIGVDCGLDERTAERLKKAAEESGRAVIVHTDGLLKYLEDIDERADKTDRYD